MVSLWTEGEKITGNFASWRVLVCCGFALLFSYLLRAYNRSIGGQREVDPGVGHQVGLELSQVHIEGSVESQRGSDGGHNLADEPVQVGVRWSLNIEIPPADVVDCLVVNLDELYINVINAKAKVKSKTYHEGTVGVLQSSMGSQD